MPNMKPIQPPRILLDKIARYGEWVLAQERGKALNFDQIRPGFEWVRGYPVTVAIAVNMSADRAEGLRRDIQQACLTLPPDTPEPLIRAEAFCRLLQSTEKVVLPDFDLCGHWFFDGRIRRTFSTPPEADARVLQQIDATHPLRGFLTRWDHAAPETNRFLREGIGGILNRILAQLQVAPSGEDRYFLEGMRMEVHAFSDFVAAHADEADKGGKSRLADSLRHLALKPPRTFFEALQLIWLRYVAFIHEGRGAMAFGRIDQHLYPFYQADLAAGRLTREEALDLLCQLRAFATNADNTASTTIGGWAAEGCDGTNEVTYLFLEAADFVRVPDLSLFARFNEKSPGPYLEACARLIFSGGGMPAMVNDEVSLKQLAQIGISGADALNHCFTGCAHLFVEGVQVPWTEAQENICFPHLIMGVLKELRALPEETVTYDRVLAGLRASLTAQIQTQCRQYNTNLGHINFKTATDLFYSAFADDCIERHREHSGGGSRYPGVLGIDLYGLALAADMLMSLKKLVFDEKALGFEQMMAALDANFEGEEALRQKLLNGAPKFGNDHAEVDAIAVQLVELASEELGRQTPSLCDGSVLRPIFPGTAQYVRLGQNLMATPDGRRAGEPYSDSGSPVAGRDTQGLSALLNSMARIDHSRFNGMALNMRLNPSDFKGESGMKRFLALLAVMRQKGLQELQFNCVTNDQLRQAQQAPDRHGNLLIRVAGYSARFVQLQTELQEAIIARHQHD